MSRRSRIRWTKNDEKELARLVKNYNAKISRIIKKDPNMKEFLPDRVKKKNIKEGINTRSDLKKQMHSLERFLRRGAEEVIYNNFEGEDRIGITKYEKREIEIQVATINRLKSLRRKEIEEMETTSRGKKVGYKNKEMGRMENLQMLQPKVFNFKTKKKKDFIHFKKGLEDVDVYINMKDLILRENYIDALYEHLGENPYVNEIADKINSMPIDKFIGTYYSEKEAIIEFIYDPLQASAKIETLYNDVWKISKDELHLDDTDDEEVSLAFSNLYEVYNSDNRVIKRFGTERHAKRFVAENKDAIEFKFVGQANRKRQKDYR